MKLHKYLLTLFVSLAAVFPAFGQNSEGTDLPQEADKQESVITEEDKKFELRDLSNYGMGAVPEGIVQVAAGSQYFSPYVFIVDKGARVLSIWEVEISGLKRVAAYTIDIGKNVSDKRILGDKATPEGVYFMLEKYEGSALDYKLYGSRAFTLDYPNFFDKRERKTGSGIWIHAVPDTVSLRRGSRGCVVVRDEIIKQLHPYFKPGFTPVIIHDEVNMRPKQSAEADRRKLNNLVESWRNSWIEGNIDQYIGHYHSEFRALGMNKDGWRKYKKRLKKQYVSVSVKISKPVIYQHDDELIVRFIQDYSSDQYQDIGEKTLFLKKENGEYRIIGEQWRRDESRLAQEELRSTSTVSFCQSEKDCGQKTQYSN